MSRVALANLAFPLVGLALLLLISSGSGVASSFFVWFALAGILQAGGAMMFRGQAPASWKLGVAAFWLSAACYMGGYSDLVLQAYNWDFDVTESEWVKVAILADDDKTTVIYLQYVMSLLFVAVFCSLGAFSSREAQESFGLEVKEQSSGRPVHE